MKRVMICGGMEYDIPRWIRDQFEIHHVERASASKLKNPPIPDLVIANIGFASHELTRAARLVAEKYRVPFILGPTFSHILVSAQQAKIDWFSKDSKK